MKKVVRIDPDDIGAQLLMGIHYIYAKDKSTGKKEIKSALEKLNELGESIHFNEMTASQQFFLKESLIAYYDYMHEIFLSNSNKMIQINSSKISGSHIFTLRNNQDMELLKFQKS